MLRKNSAACTARGAAATRKARRIATHVAITGKARSSIISPLSNRINQHREKYKKMLGRDYPMKVLKSILAVVAGFVAVFILSVATDAVLETLRVFPPQSDPNSYVWWMLLLALIYRSIYAVAGGYITATLAPDRPMNHSLALGLIGMLFATLGAIVNWDLMPESRWYPVLLLVLTLPSIWLGATLRIRKS